MKIRGTNRVSRADRVSLSRMIIALLGESGDLPCPPSVAADAVIELARGIQNLQALRRFFTGCSRDEIAIDDALLDAMGILSHRLEGAIAVMTHPVELPRRRKSS